MTTTTTLSERCAMEVKPYRMSAPHHRMLAAIIKHGRSPLDYDGISERVGVSRKAVPVFVCHLHRNGLIRRVGRLGAQCFEACA
jgi:predicted transcriptional regulator